MKERLLKQLTQCLFVVLSILLFSCNTTKEPKQFTDMMELANYIKTLDNVSFDELCNIQEQVGTLMLTAKFETQDDVIDMGVAYCEYKDALESLAPKASFKEEDLTEAQKERLKQLNKRIRRGENVVAERIEAKGLRR